MNNNAHPLCHICSIPANFLMKKDGFDEYVCPDCNLSFVFPQPDKNWLKEEVYSYESGYQGNKKSNFEQIKEDKKTKTIITKLLKLKSKGNLLDVGCSSGEFMFWAEKRGFSCKGVEVNKRTADIARVNGFDVFGGFLDTAPFKKGEFDIIFLGDVIEHVNDPRNLIKTCKNLLNEKGILVISTPNMNCFWSHSTFLLYEYFRIPWSSLTPPYHLFQFSFNNLDKLLLQQGLSIETEFFMKPPRLLYNLGSLHLLKVFKQKQTIKNLLYMAWAFMLYTLFYTINIVLHPFLKEDFGMVVFYRKDTDIV